MTSFNLTYIFIPHQISNLFLIFSKWLYSSGKQSEENICLQATYLEPKPSFFIFFLRVARFLFNFFKVFKVFSYNVKKMTWLKKTVLDMPTFELHLLKLFCDFYLFKMIIEVIQTPVVIFTHFKLMVHSYIPWKHQNKCLWFSYIFRGYRNGTLAWNGLTG